MRFRSSAPRVTFACLSWLCVQGCGGAPAATGMDLSATIQDLATPAARDLSMPLDLAVVDLGPCGQLCVLPTAICDAASGKCVACVLDGDCPDQTICRANQCMSGCSAMHAACGDAGSCDVDLGACRGCLSDADCGSPLAPACDKPSGRCVACTLSDDKCAAGTYCAALGSCVAGCKSDVECQLIGGLGGASARCCNHVCQNTATSPANCGACNAACNLGGCCDGKCTAVGSDVKNCGGCKMACLVNNNVPACSGGVCKSGACNMGYGDCDGDAGNGCEVSLASDPMNCGACAKPCSLPNSSTACLNGACLIASCNAGFLNCNMKDADGCEVVSATDPNNCGSCNAMCSLLPNTSSAGCKASKCTVGACALGYGNCNGKDVDGCESRFSVDPANCGGCGMPCPAPPNVQAICANSQCSLGACVAGYTDCDKNAGNGCEVHTDVDAKNCGACGMVCAAGANAVSACAAAKCTLTCNLNFGDCDKDLANGCELPLAADGNNCGACGLACAKGSVCVAGKCQSCGADAASARPSCNDILVTCGSPSGVYWLLPANVKNAYQAWCDMSTDGGGWTAYFVGINGSPNVFDHFEDSAVNCADPATSCLRRLPADITIGNDFLATCGAAVVKYTINAATLNYFQNGVQGGNWQANGNLKSIAGGDITMDADQTWTGSGNNKGWIVGDQANRTFSSSYNLNNSWDSCNGVGDTKSVVMLLYR